MTWSLRLVTLPLDEPVSLDEAKVHLKVEHGDEDAYITGLITAARQFAENYQRRAYLTQEWELTLDEWPRAGRPLMLPRPPLQAVQTITYRDRDGAEHSLDPATYLVDTRSEPGRVVLAPGAMWPTSDLQPVAGITVRYTAGYGATGDVPAAVKQAILLLISHWHEFREPVVMGTIVTEVPFAVKALLGPDRVVF